MGCLSSIQNQNDNEIITNSETLIKEAYHYDLRLTHTFIKIINSGAFGQVKLYQEKGFNKVKYAIKTIQKELIITVKKIHRIKSEIDIVSQLDHPNIVNYYCTIETYNNFNILMEFLPGKSLSKLIKEKREKFSIEKFRFIIYQALSALCYLHNKEIVHRDIKPENIVTLTDNLDIKIVDFGLSFSFKNIYEKFSAGSPSYMAPEAFKGIISSKNDIWAVGIIYYIFCYGKYPFEIISKSINHNYDNIIKFDADFNNNKFNDVKDEDIDLIKKMLDKNFESRISAQEAIKSNIFNNVYDTFFEDITYEQLIEDFFTENTLYLIRKYVQSSIIKKAFLYMVILVSSYPRKKKYKKIFVAIDKYFDYYGYITCRTLFNEFLKRNLINESNRKLYEKIFIFIDLNHPTKGRTKYKKKKLNKKKINILKYEDWGIITYSIFLSFYFSQDILQLKDEEEKFKYIFKFFCDRPIGENLIKHEIVNINGETLPKKKEEYDKENPETLTKNTFMRFVYKHNLLFNDSQDEIDKFFSKYTEPIHYDEFKNLIFTDEGNYENYNEFSVEIE